ncbi:MAG: hypothetical protein ACK5AA_12400, partial [Akkermansiaceae bacterium]
KHLRPNFHCRHSRNPTFIPVIIKQKIPRHKHHQSQPREPQRHAIPIRDRQPILNRSDQIISLP